MNEHASIVRVERHEVGPGKRDEIAGVLKSAAEAARDASGCFGAQVASSDQEPEQIVLIERWKSAEDMEGFHRRPEFASLERSLDGSPKVEVFTTA